MSNISSPDKDFAHENGRETKMEAADSASNAGLKAMNNFESSATQNIEAELRSKVEERTGSLWKTNGSRISTSSNLLFQRVDRDASPKAFPPPQKDPTGQYASAYRRFGAMSEASDARSTPIPRTRRKRVSPRLTPPPPNIAGEAEGNFTNQFRPLKYGQHIGLEEDGLEATPTVDRSITRAPSRGLQASFQTPSPPPFRRPGHNPTKSIEMDGVGDRTPNPSPGPFDEGSELDEDGLEYGRPSRDFTQRDPSSGGRGFQRVILSSPAFEGSDPKEDSDDLFIHQMSSQAENAAAKKKLGKRPLFNHDDFVKDGEPSHRPSNNKRRRNTNGSTSVNGKDYFNNPGRNLQPSRYSGADLGWGMNQDPPSVPQNAVSDAALVKRGLKRGQKDKVCKRGYGANDPENVAIVNMKESDNMSFKEIVEVLNKKRIAEGKNPSLSVCGVTSRYNRTAPLLFGTQGLQFIPLSKRGKGQVITQGPLTHKPKWDDEADLLLVECYKAVEAERWQRVADLFNAQTDKLAVDAEAVARRHTML